MVRRYFSWPHRSVKLMTLADRLCSSCQESFPWERCQRVRGPADDGEWGIEVGSRPGMSDVTSRPTVSKPTISMLTELVRPDSCSWRWLKTETRALPRPSSRSPLARTPSIVLFPASTATEGCQHWGRTGAIARTQRGGVGGAHTVPDDRNAGLDDVFNLGRGLSDEDLATAGLLLLLAGLTAGGGCGSGSSSSSSSSLLVAADVLGQQQVAVGAHALGDVDQSLVGGVPLLQCQLHGVAIVLVSQLEDGLAEALL